jgi:prepilin-type N-terminal cleavage/methylation domain-containing protein
MTPTPCAPPAAATTSRAGITLTEMLIVVTMIGILAAITGSRLDWTRYRADSAARGLSAQLTAAQRTAVSLQNDVRISVPSSDRLRIHEDVNNNGVEDSGERITHHVLDDGFRLGQFAMAPLPVPADPTELTSFVFRRDGTSSRGGSLYVSSPRDDPTCKWCRAVSIARATGRAVSYSHARGTWTRGN